MFLTTSLALVILMTTSTNVRAKESGCDFSAYKPLVVSHPLVGAAVKKVEPKYPAIGTRVRVEGDVKVKILVNRKGNVVGACVTEGHPLLRSSAVHAAVQWEFKPNFGFAKKQKKHYIESFIVFKFRLVGQSTILSPLKRFLNNVMALPPG